jgi:RNA polymerase sigma factor (sigma-70 family)
VLAPSANFAARPGFCPVIEVAPPDSQSTNDHALMLEVRDGDVAQLGELFVRHRARLYGFFVRLTGHRASSEDLVQLVFYRILRYRHTYRDTGSFTAWMYFIARRTLSDYRRHATEDVAGSDTLEFTHLTDDAPHAAETATSRDESQLLARAMATLAPDEREILVLARYQEMPHADIAQVLDISVGAVKVRVHRAMKELRRAFLKLSAAEDSASQRTRGLGEISP